MIYALCGVPQGGFGDLTGIRVKLKLAFGQSPLPGFGEKYFSNLPSWPS
jgi:hypothetical protein